MIEAISGKRILLCAAASAALAVAAAGCERRTPPPQETPPPPVAEAPATEPSAAEAIDPASTQPTSSLMNVDGQVLVFPAARVRLESDGQRLVALLFSDDPKDALKDNYTGNSFYLRMHLDVDDPEQLHQAAWHYTAPSSSEREDSPYGIYLGGRRLQLQPYDVHGRFRPGEEGGTEVLLSGQFRVMDDRAGRGPAQLVVVAANLPVRIDVDDRGLRRE